MLVTFVLLLSGLSCEWPWQKFKRNPNLRLLKSERETNTLFYPVWSPDGTEIYYLRTGDFGYNYSYGALWKVSVDGTSASEVLSDTFCALAFSANGQEIALTTGNSLTGGSLVIFDLARLAIDTIPTSMSDIFDVKFSRTNSRRVYFCSLSQGIYRVNIDGSDEESVEPSYIGYFDLTLLDSIVPPSIHPSDRYIARGKHIPGSSVGTDDIVLIDIETGDTTYLRANPYKICWITTVSWSPGGDKLVFTAHEFAPGDPLQQMEGELWILEQVIDKSKRNR